MASPRKILLATDLSARSDRAMDRAAILLGEWQGELVVVHALEPPAASRLSEGELAARARQELCAQLQAAGERVAIRVERGQPVEVIQRVARAEAPALIVTGVARNERFGRVELGATVEGLLRQLAAPLLVVSHRAREPYRRITVAVEPTEASRAALLAAAELFPDRPLTVFHAHGAPGGYGASDLAKHRKAHTAMAHEELERYLAGVPLPEAARARLALEVQFGDPEPLLVDWTESKDVELVVLGTRGRGRIGEFLMGSVAKRVLGSLACDALLVPWSA